MAFLIPAAYNTYFRIGIAIFENDFLQTFGFIRLFCENDDLSWIISLLIGIFVI